MSYAPADQDLASHVRRQVRAGFYEPETVIESSAELFEVEAHDVEPLVTRALAELASEKKGWPAVTDCNLLAQVFSALDDAGIVARHNWMCCNRCGHEEMADEVDAARTAEHHIDGYVFYHQQDTDRAVGGGGLHLRYAALDDGDAAARDIGMRIRDALRTRGFEVIWNGDPTRTINLPKFEWRRHQAPDER